MISRRASYTDVSRPHRFHVKVKKGGRAQMSKSSGQKIGRSAGTGRFMSVKAAKQHPKTAVVETIKPAKKK